MRTRLAAAAGAIALAPALLHAQIGRPGAELARPTAWAITNARIVPVSGPAIDRGTIVIRNGVIAAVGPADRISAPADARQVDGTGLTVYPGLIDAASHHGVPAPRGQGAGRGAGGGGAAAFLAAQQQGQPSDEASRSRYPEGLRPEELTTSLIEVDRDAFATARGSGIAAALAVPRSGIFAGQSALIGLGDGSPQDVLLRSPVALHVGFSPIRGGYPGSLLGVFSAIRQMLYDAKRYDDLQAAYARNPRGSARPDADPSLAALQPVLARQLPVFMQAGTQREIERALDLAKEFNLRAVIVGGAEAYKVAARLSAENVPVLATVNFPRAPRETSPDADPEPRRVAQERAEAPGNAARLAAGGVRFAFSSMGLTDIGEFVPGVRRAVEAGLSRDRALRALTLDAAELLGVADRLGSIETGKIANLVLVRGDLFEQSGRVTQVFVDGRPLEARVPAARPAGAAGGAAATASASGQWLVTASVGGQEHQVTMQMTQEGDRLSGTLQGPFGAAQFSNGTIGANGEFRFTVAITTPGGTEEAVMAGTITGDAVRGTVTVGGMEPGTFAGTRGTGRPRGGREP